jgi:hypothetical protein
VQQERKIGLLHFARNDGECRHASAFSRRDTPEVCRKSPPGKQRAWGMPGARCTRSLVCAIGSKYAHEYSQRATGNHPTFPHAMVYGLFRALPGDRLSCHRRYADRSANLTPASRRQDHTSSPSAASNARQARRRVHRIPPRVRDVASRPSEWDGTAVDIEVIWVGGQAVFLKFRNEPKCRRCGFALRLEKP